MTARSRKEKFSPSIRDQEALSLFSSLNHEYSEWQERGPCRYRRDQGINEPIFSPEGSSVMAENLLLTAQQSLSNRSIKNWRLFFSFALPDCRNFRFGGHRTWEHERDWGISVHLFSQGYLIRNGWYFAKNMRSSVAISMKSNYLKTAFIMLCFA